MVAEHVGILALSVLYLFSVFGWGSLLLKLFRTRTDSFWNDLAGRVVAGLGALYACCIVLSASGIFHRMEAIVAVAAGMLASCAFAFDFARSAAEHWKPRDWNLTDVLLAGTVVLLVLLQFTFALTPLIFYDLQVYHLLAPAQFLQTGTLSHIPWNVLTNSPMAIQLTVGMSLALDPSGQVAKMLFAILGSLICVGAYLMVRPAGRRQALIASLFAASIPEFWLMQALGVVDLAIAGLTILGAIWLRESVLMGKWRGGILAGIAFGLAIGSRYQSVVLIALIVLLVLIERVTDKRPGLERTPLWLQLTITGCLVVALVSPWLIRNQLHTGNPVYPLLHETLGGPEWSASQASRLNLEALGAPFQSLSATQKILAPITILLAFPATGLFGTALLLGALVAAGYAKGQVRFAAILGLLGMVIWGLLRPAGGVPLLRFNATSIVLLLAVTGALLGTRWNRSNAGTMVAVVLAGGSFIVALAELQSLFPAVQSLYDPAVRTSLHRSNVPASAAMDYANEHLDAAHNKVLIVGETRGFWLQIPYVAPSAFNGPQLDSLFGKADENGDYSGSLAKIGITHLLIPHPKS